MNRTCIMAATCFVIVLLCVVVSGSAQAAAADTAGVYVPGTAELQIRDITIAGSYGYASVDSGLAVFDVSDPAHPAVVSSLGLGTRRRWQSPPPQDAHMRVRLDGHLAYVPMWNDGVFVVDISDPLNPAEIGHLVTPYTAREVVVAGGYAYVGGPGAASLMVFDVSDPTAPASVYESPNIAAVQDLDILGNRLLVSAFNFYIFDISTPDHPVLDTVFSDIVTTTLSVRVHGSYACLSDLYPGTRNLEDVGCFDLSDPETPVFLGKEGLNYGGVDAVIVNRVAYVANSTFGLHAVSLRDMTMPVEMKNYGPLYSPMSIEVCAPYVYLCAGEAGMYTFELEQRGDVNGDGVITSADVIWLVSYIFRGGPPPAVLNQGDVDCFDGITSADVITMVNFIFKAGDPLVCP